MPKPKRLGQWYKDMLDMGKTVGVVFDYQVRTHRGGGVELAVDDISGGQILLGIHLVRES